MIHQDKGERRKKSIYLADHWNTGLNDPDQKTWIGRFGLEDLLDWKIWMEDFDGKNWIGQLRWGDLDEETRMERLEYKDLDWMPGWEDDKAITEFYYALSSCLNTLKNTDVLRQLLG